MFEYIKGKVTYIAPAYLVLESNGVGYLLYMANPYRYTDKMGEEATIYVYHDIRQDAMLLYGFRNYQEKQLFLKLVRVSGIGPKSAMAILANEDHSGLVQAIENDDVAFLMKFPGVGKKTAGQLVLDLKGKLGDLELPGGDARPAAALSADEETNKELSEAVEALLALGYSKKEAAKVKKHLETMDASTTDAYLREGLRLLTKR
ncbi:Holliday junction branch migration protein RuvA [Atopococcus tabaci]|uniref:Holliday junction branch migration protein RuvA n=1 Tax=Atopococcus tabaci TaxID=269774 RepID=UPI000419E503|nr:Holliday junction branch migration protein RuvA [Atopococcus tabaci]